MISRKEIACDTCANTVPMPPMRTCAQCRSNYARAHYREYIFEYVDKAYRWKKKHPRKARRHSRDYRKRQAMAGKTSADSPESH